MVEQKSNVVAWLRRIMKRNGEREDDEFQESKAREAGLGHPQQHSNQHQQQQKYYNEQGAGAPGNKSHYNDQSRRAQRGDDLDTGGRSPPSKPQSTGSRSLLSPSPDVASGDSVPYEHGIPKVRIDEDSLRDIHANGSIGQSSGQASPSPGFPSPAFAPTNPGSGSAAGSAHGGGPRIKGLADNASVMTIASSSKRRRRSLDTNASTRALAAESIFSWADSADAQSQLSREPESEQHPQRIY